MKALRLFALATSAMMLSLLAACDKDSSSGDVETWLCNVPNAYSVTATVDKSAKTVSYQVLQSDTKYYLLFHDGDSFHYTIQSDSSLRFDCMGDYYFTYKAISPNKLELEYRGHFPDYLYAISNYIFEKQI